MTRLEWSKNGDKLFEWGLDRGVLFPSFTDEGVAWNGLLSVDEKLSGKSPKETYLDGIKISSVPPRDDFSGSIQAYTYPDEFGVCDGTVSPKNGLFITQQRKRPFSLSYRTGVGNDIRGIDHGYKIHIVYNALPFSSGLVRSSRSQVVDPLVFQWEFTTTPILYTADLLPTAHIYIDTRTTHPFLVKRIEDRIYGTATTPAKLPSIEELIEMLGYGVFEVVPNQTGRWPITRGDHVDLMDSSRDGTYFIPEGSRLKEVKPGRYKLET